jgi:hypothetical protein
MVNLYNEDFFLSGKLKSALKKIFGRNYSGPLAVFDGLRSGMMENGEEVVINKDSTATIVVASVLGGVKTLQWAIEQKKRGKIKKLIAGPNIFISPLENNKLALSPEIDKYVVPSLWVKNWWLSMTPEISGRLEVWAAGVEVGPDMHNEYGHCLIYFKSGPKELLDSIQKVLTKRKMPMKVIHYGKYSPGEYKEKLANAKFSIFISESESQGLALHTSWMAGIPTLVWNRGFAQVGNIRIEDPKISAPYLTAECGLFFTSREEFSVKLESFLQAYGTYKAREYSLRNFTFQVCAKKYLDILQG